MNYLGCSTRPSRLHIATHTFYSLQNLISQTLVTEMELSSKLYLVLRRFFSTLPGLLCRQPKTVTRPTRKVWTTDAIKGSSYEDLAGWFTPPPLFDILVMVMMMFFKEALLICKSALLWYITREQNKPRSWIAVLLPRRYKLCLLYNTPQISCCIAGRSTGRDFSET